MRLGPVGIAIALLCAVVGALLLAESSVAARVFALLLALPVIAEGLVLSTNWRGATVRVRDGIRRLGASPLASISIFEVRMIGGFLALMGLILAVGSGARL